MVIVECHILCKLKLMVVILRLRKFHDVLSVALHQLELQQEDLV